MIRRKWLYSTVFDASLARCHAAGKDTQKIFTAGHQAHPQRSSPWRMRSGHFNAALGLTSPDVTLGDQRMSTYCRQPLELRTGLDSNRTS